MHRQSLGSPSSKHNGASAAALKKEDSHIIASAVEIQNPLKHKLDDNEDEGKSKMKSQQYSHITNAEKFVVHLIPLLILLCIVILFLFSHYPSQKDLGEFEEELPANLDLKKREQIPRVMKVGESTNILGIQSMRNLQEDKKVNLKYYRLHRKIGDFKVKVKQD